jgi:lysophospholipase
MTRSSTRLLLALPLVLGLGSSLFAQDVTTYRLEGIHDARGPFVGTLALETTAAGVEVREQISFASGVDAERSATGQRTGNRLVVDFNSSTLGTGMAGRLAGRNGTVAINGGRLVVIERGDQAFVVSEGGAGRSRAIGTLLRWGTEADLPARTPAILANFDRGQRGTLNGKGGVPLAYVAFRAQRPKGAIVFASGRGGHARKYAELVYDLRTLGYSIYMLDHRGQGSSGRLLSDPQKGHVDDFDDYVADLKTFVDQVVRRDVHQRIFGLGHSMGGAIVTRYAELHPNDFNGIVLSAPMLGIPITWVERRVVNLMVRLGKAGEFAKGEGPDDPSTWNFDTSRSSSSHARFEFKRQLLLDDPSLNIGGPTYGWVNAAIRGNLAIYRDAAKVTAPVLLFQAGDDTIVVNQAQDMFSSRNGGVEKIVVPGAKHGLLLETDAIRSPVLNRIVGFLDRLAQRR